MSSPLIHKGQGIQGSGMPLMARILQTDGSSTPMKQADVTAVEYHFFKEDAPTVDLAPAVPNLAVADVFFDILINDEFWTTDEVGYNFRYDVLATEHADGNTTYRFEFKVTPVVGQPFYILYDNEIVSAYSESLP